MAPNKNKKTTNNAETKQDDKTIPSKYLAKIKDSWFKEGSYELFKLATLREADKILKNNQYSYGAYKTNPVSYEQLLMSNKNYFKNVVHSEWFEFKEPILQPKLKVIWEACQ